eukprot:Sspe_Gene.112502::Locus_95533_Transcript_1_1_Confidence_1.000_Length_665::g.112502::m.112502
MSLEVNVVTEDGSSLFVEVEPEDTVGDLCAKVSSQAGIPSELIHIAFGDQRLERALLLSDSGITQDAVLRVVPPVALSNHRLLYPLGEPAQSLESATEHTLYVINQTTKYVQLFWVDYDGRDISYKMVPPKATHTQPTWATHIWKITGKFYEMPSSDATIVLAE